MPYNISPNCQIDRTFYQDLLNKTFGTKSGFFVDIGAADGYDCSNTSCLAEAGWGGIMIEPVPEYFESCKKRYLSYPRISVLDFAVSNQNGKKNLLKSSLMSTLETSGMPYDRALEHNDGQIIVNCKTLDSILEQYNISEIDILSLDVEGHEMSVLQSFDILRYKPKLCIIELHECLCPERKIFSGFKNDILVAQANKYFADAGYDKIFCDNINTIFGEKCS